MMPEWDAVIGLQLAITIAVLFLIIVIGRIAKKKISNWEEKPSQDE